MRPLRIIAQDIAQDWQRINVYARPYLDAMRTLDSMADRYYCDDARSVVLYFLSNANTWRGPVAKAIKAELRSML